ncbi:helix-turn-helix domain-containing protein [Acuticoccus sp. M5D2P5]|uniref:helix-turn-helix domain-containing protein n=1 Tax=Acuticoccus kalidii TaxID=2910977 RepID=UPI001F2850AA|nr:helix-turn-helix domain-containing protein [Acuticoccus kalidii]MCF3935427.1 helix-turn-helix domain-containing protein [Acuticoccus kalidii]
MITVGLRVRKRRSSSRISRRVLSERSGISERFIADLEYGKGNISIVRLKAIADALEIALEELVRDPEPKRTPRPAPTDWRAHPAAIADLFRHAGASEQEAVVKLLISSMRGRRAA